MKKTHIQETLNKVETDLKFLEATDANIALQNLQTEHEDIKEQFTSLRDTLKPMQLEVKAMKDSLYKDMQELEEALSYNQRQKAHSSELESLNQIKKRLYECEKQMLEADHAIKAANSEIGQILIMREVLNDKEAEKFLKTSIEEIEKNIEIVDESVDFESLDFDPNDSTTQQIRSELENESKELKKHEKKIEDYERVALLAPECKKEIE